MEICTQLLYRHSRCIQIAKARPIVSDVFSLHPLRLTKYSKSFYVKNTWYWIIHRVDVGHCVSSSHVSSSNIVSNSVLNRYQLGSPRNNEHDTVSTATPSFLQQQRYNMPTGDRSDINHTTTIRNHRHAIIKQSQQPPQQQQQLMH